MIDEGYIKFHCDWKRESPSLPKDMAPLRKWRDVLHEHELIGHDNTHNVGFGNVSMRDPKLPREFIISGTQTGHLYPIEDQHFARVSRWDIAANSLECIGEVKASSESLTHAAIYDQDATVTAVFHVHHQKWWEACLHQVPTTGADIPYGTPEMAYEIGRLFRKEELGRIRFLAMAGHDGGLIGFGPDLDTAGAVILEQFRAFGF